MANLLTVEGIGPTYAEKLKGAGIASTEALLKAGATPKGRKELAEKAGISDALILEWVNHVDLFRIKGVAEEYADLLKRDLERARMKTRGKKVRHDGLE